MGLRFELLTVGHDDRSDGVAVAQGVHMFHAVGQKTAGAAGGVIEGPDEPRVVDEHLVIRVEQQLDGQMDHIARGHEVLGRLVHLGPEAADQVFIDVGHDPFRNRVRVQVDGGEVLSDLVEDPGLVHPGHRVREVELLEDDAGVVGEGSDVILEVLAGPGRAEAAQVVIRGVVERVAGLGPQDHAQINRAVLHRLDGFAHLIPGRFQHAFQAAQQGERQNYLAEIDVLEVPPEVVRVLPDEIGERGVRRLGTHLCAFTAIRFRLKVLFQ